MRPEEPVTMTTYRRADGELIWGEFDWVLDVEYFDDIDEPVELIEQIWICQSVRRVWKVPTLLFSCGFDDCDEDAEMWVQRPDGEWLQACPTHRVQTEVEAKEQRG